VRLPRRTNALARHGRGGGTKPSKRVRLYCSAGVLEKRTGAPARPRGEKKKGSRREGPSGS